MIDLGSWFDDKPLLRAAVPIGPVLAVTLAYFGIVQPAMNWTERAIEDRERWAEWATDWRGRPYREIDIPDHLDAGENPAIFKIVCREDADGKVAHATISDPDGIPGLEDLRVGETVRVMIDFPHLDITGRWRRTDSTWHMEEEGYLVSENNIHSFLSRANHFQVAPVYLNDAYGREIRFELPFRGMPHATDAFFERCKLPSFRPNFVREHGDYYAHAPGVANWHDRH